MKHLSHSSPRLPRVAVVVFCLSVASGCAVADPACGGINSKACAASAINDGNFERAFEILFPLANAGDAESQTTIALLISNGYGVEEAKGASRERRQLLALPWIRKAAIGSDPKAVSWLADGYKHGWFGFPIDPKRENCLRSAAAVNGSAAECLK